MRRPTASRVAATILAAALGTVGLAGCGGQEEGPQGGAQGKLKIGLAYDIGGRGDQSFNDAAARGLDRAKAEFRAEAKELEAAANETDAQKAERLRLLAEGGFNPIIGVGLVYAKAMGEVAKEFPNIKFAIVDDASAKGPNIANLTFTEHEGSFLVGAAAALKTKKKNVGFVGGVEIPLIKKFEAGYAAGVAAVDNGIKVQIKYLTQPPDFTGFTDTAKGRTAAEGMFDDGADIVYHAAGAAGAGVFQAAKAANGLAIGVDSDQYHTAAADVKDVILTSMIKKVDVAVYELIRSVHHGQFQAGEKVFDLKANGVDYSTSGGKVDDIKAKLDEFKQKIQSGEIQVPSS